MPNQPDTESEKPTDWKRVALDILETLVLAVVLYFGINAISGTYRPSPHSEGENLVA